MEPAGSAARAAARRQARRARSGRDVAHRQREQEIEEVLAEYYVAAARAERIRDAARRKAERAAAPSVAQAAGAVRKLRELVGANAEVARLCGLSPSAVRAMLAASDGGSRPDDPDAEGGEGHGR